MTTRKQKDIRINHAKQQFAIREQETKDLIKLTDLTSKVTYLEGLKLITNDKTKLTVNQPPKTTHFIKALNNK